ncbi:MAG: cytochrome c oxidase assembly protein [Gammaproteobacteria bacterium]|nr:cytochrome c oxidase assembly protein [Gammaproteobacteria bacterium]
MDAKLRHALRLTAVVGAMFAFGYALVPLYNMLCDAIGLNGRSTQNSMLISGEQAAQAKADESRSVTVEFVTTVNGGRPWKFAAETARVRVHPGRLETVNFYVENTQDKDVVAQAVPHVAPWNAAKYLRKTECFCFQRQPLKAGEGRLMPMRFMLDPELPDEVDTVTLSYTFFDVTELAQQNAARPKS